MTSEANDQGNGRPIPDVIGVLRRLRVVEIVATDPYLRARIEPLAEEAPEQHDIEAEALGRSATSLFQQVVSLSPTLPDELATVVTNTQSGGALADVIASSLPTLPLALKQALLETTNVKERLQKLVTALGKEAEVLGACRGNHGDG